MKANKAPEKLYLLPNGLISYCRNTDEDIEYTCTDAFIEKACEYLEPIIFSINLGDRPDTNKFMENFKEYLKK